MPETKVAGNEILVSNRLFVSLKQLGMCDAGGKPVFAYSFSGKRVAEPDRPIRSLLLPLMNEILELGKWTSREEYEADIAALREYVDGLHIIDKTGEAGEGEKK